MLGNSSLRADYTVSKEGQIIKKANKFYYLKLPQVNVETLIKSMNTNLNHLSQDIAFTFVEQNRKNKRK